MAITDAQRKELAAFLRNRRERLTPEAAGLTHSYGRRRTPGLRREELAQLAGVSVTWYTWLEQARRIRVSEQVLHNLARALQLGAAERTHLFRLAGELPPDVRPPCGRRDVPPQYLEFLRRQDPLPAFVVNRRFDILAWNHGLAVLLPYLGELGPDRRNTVTMMFDERTRSTFPEHENDVIATVALFRAQVADQLANPAYATMVERLERDHALFRALWHRRDLATPHPSVRAFAHPLLGRLDLGYVKLRLAGVDATLVVLQPLPGQDLPDGFRALVGERTRRRPGLPDPDADPDPHGGRAQDPEPEPVSAPAPAPAPNPAAPPRRIPRPHGAGGAAVTP